MHCIPGRGAKTLDGRRVGGQPRWRSPGQCESLEVGSIFKDEKPLENLEQR